jgi:hypothetical protein
MNLPLGRRTVLSLATAAMVAASGLGLAQEGKVKAKASESKGSPSAERASGVIIKVEPVTKGATPGSTITDEAKKGRQVPRTVRLTINTAAVWRDWARDQATEDVSKSARKDAEEGQNSVATKGQPATADTTVMVDVGPDTRVETRFRSPTDETSKGAATPEEAREEDEGTSGAAKSKSRAGKSASTEKEKGPRFGVGDLKPGLFVEAEYRHLTAQNPASVITVIRPLGGPDTSAKEAAPATKKGARKPR